MTSQTASSPLWLVLEEKGTNEQRRMVEHLVAFAAGMLDRVNETFPTYTLHTAKHAENVVQLMEGLLGEYVSELSALEAALLILSAYYHDIGMVFKPDERGELVKEQPHFFAYSSLSEDWYGIVSLK